MDIRYARSLDNLLNTIADLQRMNQILVAALGALIEKGMNSLENCDVINTTTDLLFYIEDLSFTYIILVNCGGQPVALSSDEVQAMVAAGTFEAWVKSQWTERTQAIALP